MYTVLAAVSLCIRRKRSSTFLMHSLHCFIDRNELTELASIQSNPQIQTFHSSRHPIQCCICMHSKHQWACKIAQISDSKPVRMLNVCLIGSSTSENWKFFCIQSVIQRLLGNTSVGVPLVERQDRLALSKSYFAGHL